MDHYSDNQPPYLVPKAHCRFKSSVDWYARGWVNHTSNWIVCWGLFVNICKIAAADQPIPSLLSSAGRAPYIRAIIQYIWGPPPGHQTGLLACMLRLCRTLLRASNIGSRHSNSSCMHACMHTPSIHPHIHNDCLSTCYCCQRIRQRLTPFICCMKITPRCRSSSATGIYLLSPSAISIPNSAAHKWLHWYNMSTYHWRHPLCT
jgi:hypothetical protein